MAAPLALAEAHRVEQVRGAALVQRAVRQAFRQALDPTDLDGSFARYARLALPALAVGHRRSKEVARRYYARARADAGYLADVPEFVDPAFDMLQATTSLRVVGPVAVKTRLAKGEDLARSISLAEALSLSFAKRAVLSGGRDLITTATRADRVALGWARVGDGDPCSFCAMLVSRGPVYAEETVRFRAHDGCGCGARPWFGGEDDGWSPEARALRALWDETGSPWAFRRALAAQKSAA